MRWKLFFLRTLSLYAARILALGSSVPTTLAVLVPMTNAEFPLAGVRGVYSERGDAAVDEVVGEEHSNGDAMDEQRVMLCVDRTGSCRCWCCCVVFCG